MLNLARIKMLCREKLLIFRERLLDLASRYKLLSKKHKTNLFGAIFCFVIVVSIITEQTSCAQPVSLMPERKTQNLQQLYQEAQKTAKLGNNADRNLESLQKTLQGEDVVSHQATELGNLQVVGLAMQEGGTESKSTRTEPGSYKVDGVGDQTLPKCTKTRCDVSNIMSAKSINERESKLETLGFKKDSEQFVEHNKGYIDTANHKAAEYRGKFDVINGEYSRRPVEQNDCRATSEDVFSELSTCDQYYDVKYKMCPIAQIVEIDPKYTYQCTKKRIEAIKTCNDEIVSIKCKDTKECNGSGFVLNDKDMDMKWTYSFPILTIGTIADNYWPGHCTTYDKVVKFEVKNLEKITEFKLTRVGFDDYMWIKVNGNTVYVGPFAGDRVEVRNNGLWTQVTTNGHNLMSCELGTNWNKEVNINLKPYLKEGENEIWMRVVVAGVGEGWMQISAQQNCCQAWDIKRETKCEYEGTV